MAQCHNLGRAHLLLRELRRALSSLPELGSHHTVTSIGETVIFHKGPQCLDEISKGYRNTSKGKESDSPVGYQLLVQKWGGSHKGSVAP